MLASNPMYPFKCIFALGCLIVFINWNEANAFVNIWAYLGIKSGIDTIANTQLPVIVQYIGYGHCSQYGETGTYFK